MNTKPMITTGPHSIRATPQLVQLCQEYARHYGRCVQDKIAEYQAAVNQGRPAGLRPIDDDTVVIEARRELARAQVVEESLELLRGELERLYTWHFEHLAGVYRQARKDLGLTRVEDSPPIYLAVKLTMAMLKAANPKFSEEKFIKFINN